MAPRRSYTGPRKKFCQIAGLALIGAWPLLSGCSGLTSRLNTNPNPGSTPTPQLAVVPSAIDFKSVTVGQKNSQTVQLSNSGSATLNIQTITVTGTDFSATPPALPLSLSPGANQNVTVAFAPTNAGAASGTLTITSNDPKSPANISLSGNGQVATAHTVALSWTASTSTVSGYFVFRGSVTGGPYTQISPTLVSSPAFTDSSVVSAATYYYVVTAVDSTGTQSVYSNEVVVTIP